MNKKLEYPYLGWYNYLLEVSSVNIKSDWAYSIRQLRDLKTLPNDQIQMIQQLARKSSAYGVTFIKFLLCAELQNEANGIFEMIVQNEDIDDFIRKEEKHAAEQNKVLEEKSKILSNLLGRKVHGYEASSINDIQSITDDIVRESDYLVKQSIPSAIDYLKYIFSWDLHSSIIPFIQEVVSGKVKLSDWIKKERR